MYKVVIIDDEPWTIIDIEQTLPLEELGFTISGSFRDPLTAITSIVRDKPDLIITDIRMPGMSGLELMQKLRDQKLFTEIVIISGYGEFDYAQKAIKFGASGYLLKPLNPEEAYETLKTVKDRLDKKNKSGNTKIDPKEEQSQNSLADSDSNIDNFEQLINYIDTHFSEKMTLQQLAGKFFINPNYCCMLFNKYKNLTFSQYLTGIRVDEAKKLLKDSTISLEKVSIMVGFPDYFYFSKVFKKYNGLAPKDYRKNLKDV